jgi:hypothetical protein
MELEDFETIHLARELAREKGWDHVIEAIRAALRREHEALARPGADEASALAG